MIIGNGIDIIDINRIRRVIDKYGNRFKKRCFSISEIERSEKRLNSVESYAKRYAAKEACAKALGTGLARGVFWKDIEVGNNQYGKPFIKLHGKAKKFFKNFFCFTVKFNEWFTILIIYNFNIFPKYTSS